MLNYLIENFPFGEIYFRKYFIDFEYILGLACVLKMKNISEYSNTNEFLFDYF
jgi:hypothetical protein